MRLFRKRTTTEAWTRMNIARTVYATVINHCYREAHTNQQYEQLPQIASQKAVEFADALLNELKKDDGGRV